MLHSQRECSYPDKTIRKGPATRPSFSDSRFQRAQKQPEAAVKTRFGHPPSQNAMADRSRNPALGADRSDQLIIYTVTIKSCKNKVVIFCDG